MVYSILFSFTIFYLYVTSPRMRNIRDFAILLLPIGVLLILVLSLQDNVGADYYSYLEMAETGIGLQAIERKREHLFVFLVRFAHKFNDAQVIFALVAVIQVAFLLLISFEAKKIHSKLHDFFFLYFALSLTFFNQFNGIRQYLAVYIIVYASIKLLLYDRWFLFVVLVSVSSLFHSSAVFFLGLLPVRRVFRLKWPFWVVTLALGSLFIMVNLDITPFVELVLSYTKYSHYISSAYFAKLEFRDIITKIPKLAVVMFAAFSLRRDDLNLHERSLLNFGYVACAILIMSFGSTLVWRFYQYVDLFLVFPVLVYYHRKPSARMKVFVGLALLFMLVVKILIFPEGEYLYNSIL